MTLPSILSLPSLGGAHPYPPSPPSSESDGDSIDTQSSTASSYAGKIFDCLTGHVYVGSNALQAEILQEIFNKHSEGGLLTLCVDEVYIKSADIDYPGFSYVQTSVGISPAAWRHEKIGNIEYHSASCNGNVIPTGVKVKAFPSPAHF
jgi:hypothetical protein